MDTRLMPIERLATIVADATTRAATNVTGIFRNERMTWTEQGVHAAAWDAVRHDPEVQNAIRMIEHEAFVAGWDVTGEGHNAEHDDGGGAEGEYERWQHARQA